MFVLIGFTEEIADETKDGFVLKTEQTRIALFDTEQAANEYIEKSKTKNYVTHASWRNSNQFKKSSLLCGYHWAEVQEDPVLPINPN